MEKNSSSDDCWLTLVFVALFIFSSLILVVNNNAFADTVTATPVTTQDTQNSTISADLAKRLGGNDTGIYYPLYGLSELPQVLAAKKAFPNVPFGVIINPDSGPGPLPSAEWASAITQLKSVGAVVTGYVPTKYGTIPVADVESMISSYQQFYPSMLDGISLDEVSSSPNFTSYKEISDYARSIGFPFIGANPGSPLYQGDVPLFNLIEIYESEGYPSESMLASRTFYPQYSKDVVGFEAKIHTQPTYNSTWLYVATKYAKWIYITDQTEPNPYAVFPSYFKQYLTDLASLDGTTLLGELQVGDSNGTCKVVDGNWNSVTNTCVINANLTINTGKLLAIDSGVTLTVTGTISNSGTIFNGGTINNIGTISNSGSIIGSGTFTSAMLTIKNNGTITDPVTIPYGVLSSNYTLNFPVIVPSSVTRIINTGQTFTINPGVIVTINSGGTISNFGIINNTGTVSNSGRIDNHCAATIIGDPVNDTGGTVNNPCP